jgi:glycosyltransferase involved in cell wall biosynthesis
VIHKKPKIFFVATVEFAINTFLLCHLKALSKYFDITVIVNTNDPLFLKKQGLNIRVISLDISRKISFLKDSLCFIKLLLILSKERPASIQSITPKAGLLSMLAGFFTATPIRIHTFTGQVWVNKTGFKRLFFKLIDKLIGNLSTVNLIDSLSQRDFLISENILSSKKAIVFGSGSVSGVNLNKFTFSKKTYSEIRNQVSIPHNAFVFIYLGRLNRDKGVLDLASAFAKIQHKKAFLLIAGPDEGDFVRKIKIINAHKLEQIRFVGFTSKPENFLAASNVLCLPSYREGFGNVIIEAAAMGIPAMASNIYGISDAILDKQTGLLHSPKDIGAIFKTMKYFLNNPKIVKSYGRSAKERVSAEFDEKILSKYWFDFYISIFEL